ncbi:MULTISPECIES: cytochrome P450 [Streptomycetaceae]|uniref:Cytochrome P450 protein n=1 Tax=Streptantibioticus cattleyicolor (strain ATCC 35852 / DSM 46488 / JCM 4925 / NBRC 14057 / NRRL 8057) TaxID=1003195 RepID=F8JUK6_STREN|nr:MULTISPECIES: cytochrome P450 [Streptomycetaceae]AEW95633.1 cytochrome P450 protein [Streptantibioticus cattleyicolor NRRL 8057 = DSM 46488]MYS60178.1 cytochrome P450 [Streptomyces sp. SID5468]CCB75968.1 putative cytochrome P450 [Streptantibioticus cattleyicolor NRRL 8057 = DSM 46488]
MSKQAPLVAGHPLLGSLPDLRDDTLGAYLRARRDHGDVVRFEAGPPGLRASLYAVFSADGVQQILGTEASNFRKENDVYTEIRESIGNGLLTSQDEEYIRQRRMIQPLFTRRRVDAYAGAVHDEATATAHRWTTASGNVVDVVPEMAEFALRSVTRILFGSDIESAVDVVRRNFPVIGESVLRRGVAPLRIPRTWPTPANRRTATAQRELYAICDRIIAERTAAGHDDSGDMISLLIGARDEDGSALDADSVRDQVLVFLLAGHETTATALAFGLHLLARHPDAQHAARAEVDAVLDGRPASAADLERLPYLTRVFKEAMRLYPSVAIMGRRSVADSEVCGFHIPGGSDVYVSPWVTQRHPDYWENPDAFDPDRFAPDLEAARPRYAWFPFGGGPRSCIGQYFAMLEGIIGLATFLQSYEFAAVDAEVPLELGMTMRAAGPARVRLTRRPSSGEAAA